MCERRGSFMPHYEEGSLLTPESYSILSFMAKGIDPKSSSRFYWQKMFYFH